MRLLSAALGAVSAFAFFGMASAEPSTPSPASSASAPAAVTTRAAETDKTKSADDQKVCFDDRDTGSRMSHRVCMTRKEYRARQQEN